MSFKETDNENKEWLYHNQNNLFGHPYDKANIGITKSEQQTR